MFTILTGNPVEGFAAEGLFGNTEDAHEYSMAFLDPETEYWTMAIEPPEIPSEFPADVRHRVKALIDAAVQLNNMIDGTTSQFAGGQKAVSAAIDGLADLML